MKHYSDFFGQGKHVEGVKGIGDIGEGENEMMRFANLKILEGDLVRFGDEGLPLENFGSHFLWFCHIEFMIFSCLIEIGLFLLGEVARIYDFVPVLVVLRECFGLVIGLHLNFMKL